MSDCIIHMPSEEEKKAARDEILAMQRKISGLTEADRMYLCDAGYYNDVIKGYLIAAMKNTEFGREDIEKALNGLRWAFDEKAAADASRIYNKFYEDHD